MKVHAFSSRIDSDFSQVQELEIFALAIVLFSPETIIKSKPNRVDVILFPPAIIELNSKGKGIYSPHRLNEQTGRL
jgi:hypothetical protein